MMKVIFVTDLDLWSMGKGKGGVAFTQTVEKYKGSGDEIFLISDVEKNRNSTLFSNSHNIVVKQSAFKRWIKIRKAGLLFRFLDHKIINRRFEEEIVKILNKYGYKDTVLYAYEIFGVKACRDVSHKYNIPIVSRFQGTMMVDFPYNWINRILRYPHYQALKTKTDLVIMTDDGSKGDKVLDEVKNNCKRLFLKNGLELMDGEVFAKIKNSYEDGFRYSLGIKDSEIMFLTVSRLTGWKRVDRAINGFASFLKKGGSGCLVIVGDGDQRQELEELAKKLYIQDKIIFAGAVKHEEVYNYMIASDVFLSLFDFSNLGNPLLEAMTLGKCIVTLDVGDTRSVINCENGILLGEYDLRDLGNILFDISKDKKRREEYGNSARKYAVDHFYTWETRLEIEYQEVSKLKKEA